MAPSANKAKALPNGRKAVVQPVLPILPVLSRSRKPKPATESQDTSATESQEPAKAVEAKLKDVEEKHGNETISRHSTEIDSNVNESSPSVRGFLSKDTLQDAASVTPSERSDEAANDKDVNRLGETQKRADTTDFPESDRFPPDQTLSSQIKDVAENKMAEADTVHSTNEVEVQQPNIEKFDLQPQKSSNEESITQTTGSDAPEVHVNKHSGTAPNRHSSVAESLDGSLHLPNGYQTYNNISIDGTTSNQPTQTIALPSLAAHLLQLSASKEWADWVIQVHPRGTQPFICYAHGLVLTRSSRLRSLMEQQQRSNFSGNIINLYPLRPIAPHAFEAALRFLYSDSVLPSDALFPRGSSADIRGARPPLLDYVLSYWVAGVELGLHPIASRAEQFFKELLDWDVAELAIRDAMNLVVPGNITPRDASLASEYANTAHAMIRAVLHFLAVHIDVENFKLDTSQSSSFVPSRLSQLEDSRPKTNPALASMVFGSMPSSTPMSPNLLTPATSPSPNNSFSDTVASNILLNIEFTDLKNVSQELINIHGKPAIQILTDIVEERENRRLKIILNRSISNKQRMINSATWDVVGYCEFVTAQGLQRERVGFLLPSKHEGRER